MNIHSLYKLEEIEDKETYKSLFQKFLFFQEAVALNDSFLSASVLPSFRYKNDIYNIKTSAINIEKHIYKNTVKVDKTHKDFDEQYNQYENKLDYLEGVEELLENPIEKEFIDFIIQEHLTDVQREILFNEGSIDFGINSGKNNFRVNCAFLDNGLKVEPFIVLRKIASKPFSLKEMGVTKKILNQFRAWSGLILISGPTGSAKSSTLTSMLDYYNNHEKKNIITLEDPIEFFWKKELWNKSMIYQREVWKTVKTFHGWIKAALRENPDVLVIGEVRDRETVEAMLEASNAWILVIATIHVKSTTEVLSRILGFFEWEKSKEVAVKLAGVLNFVMNQRFLRDNNGNPRIIYEWLDTGVWGLPELIKSNSLGEVRQAMKELDEKGSCPHKTLSESLMELIITGALSSQEAIEKYINESPKLFIEELEIYKKSYSNKKGISLDELEEIIETQNIFYNKKRW